MKLNWRIFIGVYVLLILLGLEPGTCCRLNKQDLVQLVKNRLP